MRKISKCLIDIQKVAVSSDLPDVPLAISSRVEDGTDKDSNWKPVSVALEEELNEAGDEITLALREKQRAMIDALDLNK